MLRVLLVAVAVGTLTACGGSTNLNQIWGGNDEAGDTLLIEARAAYDAGDFDKAETLAEKALDRNENNEEAAILLGYVSLSKGGIDPYRLARAMINLNDDEAGTGGGTGTGTGDTGENTGGGLTAEEKDAAVSKSSDASSTLSKLGTLINLSEDDFNELAEGKFSAEKNGGVEPVIFGATRPLLVPKLVTPELRQAVEVLRYMDKAMKTVCRFVSDDVKVSGEERHASAECARAPITGENAAKAHFLWAFSHLTESLVFQSVLLFSSIESASGGSNFQDAANAINTGTYTGEAGFDKFVGEVEELKNAVDVVFETGQTNSMISATLMGLDAVNRAFAAIAGLPESMREKITDAMSKLNDVGKTLGSGGVEGNTQALKGQMTENLAEKVGAKIDKVLEEKLGGASVDEIDDMPLPDETKTKIKADVTKMCTSYTSLAKGLPEEKIAKNKPKNCP